MTDEFHLVCLCAQWCGTCRDYRAAFDAVVEAFPEVRGLWFDIEDRADELGELDIENFPTVLIRRGDCVLFFGTLLPHIGHLRRMLETFLAQSAEESRDYAGSSPERRLWQENPDLLALGRQ